MKYKSILFIISILLILNLILFIYFVDSLDSLDSLDPFNFMPLGDWGCVPIGGWYGEEQFLVRNQFTKKAKKLNPKFVLNTCDNFYHSGVHNVSDSMFNSIFEKCLY